MNKSTLVSAVAEKAGISKAAAANYTDIILGVIADTVCAGEEDVAIPDFGRFFVKNVPEHQGFNPTTKEKITIEARDKVVFRPSYNISIYSRKHGNK